MKIGKPEYEVNVDSSQIRKELKKLNDVFGEASIAFERLETAMKALPKLEIEYSIVEKKKKKWYQFWK